MSTTRRSFLARAAAALAALVPAGLLRASPRRPRLRVTVNGVAVPDVCGGIRVVVDTDGDAEVGPVHVLVRGGTLTVRGDTDAALTLVGEGQALVPHPLDPGLAPCRGPAVVLRGAGYSIATS